MALELRCTLAAPQESAQRLAWRSSGVQYISLEVITFNIAVNLIRCYTRYCAKPML